MHPVQIVALVLYCVLSVVAYSLFTVYDWQVALSGAVSWASLGGSTARVALACIHVCFVAGSAVHCAVGTRFNWVPFVIGVCFNISLALQATFVYSALPLPTIIISSLAAVAGIIGIVVCCLSNRHATEKESVHPISLPKSYIAFFVLAFLGASFVSASRIMIKLVLSNYNGVDLSALVFTFQSLFFPSLLLIAIANLCVKVKSEQLIAFHISSLCGTSHAILVAPSVMNFVYTFPDDWTNTDYNVMAYLIGSFFWMLGVILVVAAGFGNMIVSSKMYRFHRHTMRHGGYHHHHEHSHLNVQKLDSPIVYSSVNNQTPYSYQAVGQQQYVYQAAPGQVPVVVGAAPNEFQK